jgi:hypothetical protein
MATDLTDRQQIDRASKAKAALDNPELTAAFLAVREALFTRFEACPVRDIEGQHECKLMLKLLEDVRANLHSVVNNGKVIEYRLSMLERAKKGIHAFRY